ESLGDFLYNNMAAYLDQEELKATGEEPEPDLFYDPSPKVRRAFVLAEVPPPKYKVTVQLPANTAGTNLRLLDDRHRTIKSYPAPPPAWTEPLNRGLYTLQVVEDGRFVNIEVGGSGDVDVSFVTVRLPAGSANKTIRVVDAQTKLVATD